MLRRGRPNFMENQVVFVVSAHGYGPASRQMEVLRVLLGRRQELSATVLTAAPEAVFRDYLSAAPSLSARVRIVPFAADLGLVQRDGLHMDHEATLRALADRFGDPARAEAEVAEAISRARPSLVIGDIPPAAFAAARRLGVPSVAVGNFDWAWIYEAYAATDPRWAPFAALFRHWQALATAAVHVAPGPPLQGFARTIAAPPIARLPLVDPGEVRARLAIPAGDRAVIVSFGGFGLDEAERRIPRVAGVTWILAPPMPDLRRPDTRFAAGERYLSLLAAADAVLTKPGYGIVCEAARARTRLLYTDRGDFPEYPWLVRWLDDNVPSVHVAAADLGADRGPAVVRAALDALFARPDRWADRFDGADRVADVAEDLLRG
jgi:hypothetical protein